MPLAADSALLLEPALLIPGRKPRGKVCIDWDHPLAKGMNEAWIFQPRDWEANLVHPERTLDLSGADKYRCMTQAETPTYAASVGDLRRDNPWVQGAYGGGLPSAIRTLTSGATASLGNRYTIVGYGAISYEGTVIGPAADYLTGYTQATGIYHSAGGTYWNLSSIPFTASKHNHFAVSRITDTVSYFQNAQQIASKVGPDSGPDTAEFYYYQISTENGNATSWFNGGLEYLYLYRNRALTQTEIASIYADPYQMLVPE